MRRRSFSVLLLLACAGGLCAAAEPLLEYQVKAVCVLNAIRFVSWPGSAFASADSPLVIGILGENPFGATLQDAVKGETVQRRSIVVRRITLDDAAAVHVLFISTSERANLETILRTLSGKSVLTVSDVDSFTEKGGMLGLGLLRGKLRLEANPEAARREKLKFDSQFLLMTRAAK